MALLAGEKNMATGTVELHLVGTELVQREVEYFVTRVQIDFFLDLLLGDLVRFLHSLRLQITPILGFQNIGVAGVIEGVCNTLAAFLVLVLENLGIQPLVVRKPSECSYALFGHFPLLWFLPCPRHQCRMKREKVQKSSRIVRICVLHF